MFEKGHVQFSTCSDLSYLFRQGTVPKYYTVSIRMTETISAFPLKKHERQEDFQFMNNICDQPEYPKCLCGCRYVDLK